MTEYFSKISKIKYEGPNSKNPLSFRYYDPKQKFYSKTLEEHLRIAVCYWHTFCWTGADMFGLPTMNHKWLKGNDPMKAAHQKVDAAFEFYEKLGTKYFCFHDRDVSPEGSSLKETNDRFKKIADKIGKKMSETKMDLLWGTADLFSHPRYMAGAATNPDPEVFAYAVGQVKQALDITKQLKGHNYVLWGGREGYDTLLNTDMKKESDQLGHFLSMLVDYKYKIGFKGLLLIEPKPCEPTKHQYDHDVAHVLAFLSKHGLESEFKVNIEGNHATMAGHTFSHEVAYAIANQIFGSVDANQGDPQLGWDTDQFPMDLKEFAYVNYLILKNGGFTSGGFNLDTKLRRPSVDLEDLFYAHICGIDTLSRSFHVAVRMIEERTLRDLKEHRYGKWDKGLGAKITSGSMDFESIAKHVLKEKIEPKPISGKQEMLENYQNKCL